MERRERETREKEREKETEREREREGERERGGFCSSVRALITLSQTAGTVTQYITAIKVLICTDIYTHTHTHTRSLSVSLAKHSPSPTQAHRHLRTLAETSFNPTSSRQWCGKQEELLKGNIC